MGKKVRKTLSKRKLALPIEHHKAFPHMLRTKLQMYQG